MNKVLKLVTAGALCMSCIGAGAASAQAATPSKVASQVVAGISVRNAPAMTSRDALLAWMASNPTTSVLKVTTGEIVSVDGDSSPSVRPLISYRNVCQSTDAYWQVAQTPYANACFYGSAGRTTGNWPKMQAFLTGKYTAQGGWISPTDGSQLYTPKLGPGSKSSLVGGTATADTAQIF